MFQRARDFQDLIAQHVGRFKDLRVPEPQDIPALAFQPLCAVLVAQLMSRKIMLAAIKLDDQTNVRAGEVGHIGADRMLAAKF